MKNLSQNLYDFFAGAAPVAISQFPVTAYVDTPLEDTNVDFLNVLAHVAMSEFAGIDYAMEPLGYDEGDVGTFRKIAELLEVGSKVVDESLGKEEFDPVALKLIKELPGALRFFQDYLERKHDYIADMHEADLTRLQSMIIDDERREKDVCQRAPIHFKKGSLLHFRNRGYLEEVRELKTGIDGMEEMAFNHISLIRGIRKFNKGLVEAFKGETCGPVRLVYYNEPTTRSSPKDWRSSSLSGGLTNRGPTRRNGRVGKTDRHLKLVESESAQPK